MLALADNGFEIIREGVDHGNGFVDSNPFGSVQIFLLPLPVFQNSRSRKPPYFLHIACFLSFHETMAQTSQGEMTRGDKYANFETGPPGAWVRMTRERREVGTGESGIQWFHSILIFVIEIQVCRGNGRDEGFGPLNISSCFRTDQFRLSIIPPRNQNLPSTENPPPPGKPKKKQKPPSPNS